LDFDELPNTTAPNGVLAKAIVYQQFSCDICNISFPSAIPVAFAVVSINCPNCLNDKDVRYMHDIPAELFERFEWDLPLTDEEKELYSELRDKQDGIQLRFDFD
jgi:hypothetical protein